MKGIILAGGEGTRLWPLTASISKQLLPIYDKPMVYYPLSILMLSGIKEILLISTKEHLPLYKKLFNDGKHLGLNITYKEQAKPRGLADAFILGEDFIGDDNVCLILGDNIFYGHGLTLQLQNAANLQSGGVIFGCYVDSPNRYGVLDFKKDGSVVGVEEKPINPKSNYAIPGLYFFDNNCIEYAKGVTPSKRGEIEITSVIQKYIDNKNLKVELFGRGVAWLDTGTHESLMQASNFVETIEKRQGLKIACLEEIAFNMDFIDLNGLKNSLSLIKSDDYKSYLKKIIRDAESLNELVA